jgi:hypothetical protein
LIPPLLLPPLHWSLFHSPPPPPLQMQVSTSHTA